MDYLVNRKGNNPLTFTLLFVPPNFHIFEIGLGEIQVCLTDFIYLTAFNKEIGVILKRNVEFWFFFAFWILILMTPLESMAVMSQSGREKGCCWPVHFVFICQFQPTQPLSCPRTSCRFLPTYGFMICRFLTCSESCRFQRGTWYSEPTVFWISFITFSICPQSTEFAGASSFWPPPRILMLI